MSCYFHIIFLIFAAYSVLGYKFPIMKNRKTVPNKLSTNALAGVGDDGCSLPSPSGINTFPLPKQAAIFGGLSTGLYLATSASITGFEAVKQVFPDAISAWQGTWGLLGLVFVLAGVSHFTIKKDFENIMPKWGAWGFWYLPGSKAFHVLWTGIVEIIAGLWLSLGTISSLANIQFLPTIWASPVADAALVLLALTVLVTPANIYMYTHGAKLPIAGPEVPPTFHLIRGILQVVLFVMFYELATPAIHNILG